MAIFYGFYIFSIYSRNNNYFKCKFYLPILDIIYTIYLPSLAIS